jgi:hypothetical protein
LNSTRDLGDFASNSYMVGMRHAIHGVFTVEVAVTIQYYSLIGALHGQSRRKIGFAIAVTAFPPCLQRPMTANFPRTAGGCRRKVIDDPTKRHTVEVLGHSPATDHRQDRENAHCDRENIPFHKAPPN